MGRQVRTLYLLPDWGAIPLVSELSWCCEPTAGPFSSLITLGLVLAHC